ncbi:2,5-diketo-D-gluconic acid reductase B [Nostocoides japonicum T1-X7]|uniref:2,5-diketo-D-gluconic acid reductase B n=1 Tax=Nostocoides japonicum T1-X7 TaxID=1194083 RepID=A0A077M3V8_9MICO|nr:aldo/keto reductase [Tetrasphaera japonica]CCH78830.1 2,5-diketo-D-gluconic acid reductase B [Tetrasphaera japonica T1-X7]
MTIPTLHSDNGAGPDGLDLPAIGFGTAGVKGGGGVDAIVRALANGYRLLDSAFNYENEGTVGLAVRRSAVPRDEIIVTSKLPGRHQRHDEAVQTVEESVYRSGLDHLDLYLIHWPNPRQGLYIEAWEALVECRERGLVTDIGVCNFLPEHLEAIVERTGVAPVVNQIELHPYFPQAEQRAYDAAHGIITEAWSPLGRRSDLLAEPVLAEVAARRGVSVGQLILRWHVQLGTLPIPKSTADERQRANLDVFDWTLDEDDLAAIATLARPDGRIAGQDPAVYEEF